MRTIGGLVFAESPLALVPLLSFQFLTTIGTIGLDDDEFEDKLLSSSSRLPCNSTSDAALSLSWILLADMSLSSPWCTSLLLLVIVAVALGLTLAPLGTLPRKENEPKATFKFPETPPNKLFLFAPVVAFFKVVAEDEVSLFTTEEDLLSATVYRTDGFAISAFVLAESSTRSECHCHAVIAMMRPRPAFSRIFFEAIFRCGR